VREPTVKIADVSEEPLGVPDGSKSISHRARPTGGCVPLVKLCVTYRLPTHFSQRKGLYSILGQKNPIKEPFQNLF
jgi:hypothetical protein